MEDLDEEEKKIFATASLENLFYSASAAQKDYEEKSRSRAISRKLEPFVGAIDQYGKALDVYSNTYSLAMAPLWGSIRVLLHVESSPHQFSVLVNILLQQVNADIPRSDRQNIRKVLQEAHRHVRENRRYPSNVRSLPNSIP
jgi:hypothetical protein